MTSDPLLGFLANLNAELVDQKVGTLESFKGIVHRVFESS
jgi:hypothetical protein